MSNWFILFLVLVLIIVPMVMEVHEERALLAQDIQSGRLISTNKAQEMISIGDMFLKRAGRKWAGAGEGGTSADRVFEEDLYRAFIAKVWFERARLEMEIQRKE